MEGFYDKEEGVAWGPVTKEEMMDDLLIYGPKNVTKRNTVGCITDISRRYNTSNELNRETQEAEASEIIILSSDEEDFTENHYPTKNSSTLSDSSHDEGCYSSEIQQLHEASQKNIKIDVDNVKDNNLDIKDRLPTPANLDEDTYDEIFEYTNEENSFEIQQLNAASQKNIKKYVDNAKDNNLNIQNRLPTPANLDEDTYGEIFDDTKEENSFDVNEDRLSPEPLKDTLNLHERFNLDKQDVNEDRVSPEVIKHSSNFYERISLDQQDVNEDRISPEGIKHSSNFYERISLDHRDDRVPPEHIKGSSNFCERISLDQQDDRVSSEHIKDSSNFCDRISLDQQDDRVSSEHIKDSSNFCDRISLDQQESPDSYTCSVSGATASISNVAEDVFNDTLAEMERLLNQQELNDSSNVDYSKADIENLSVQNESFHAPSIFVEKIKSKTDEFVYSSCEDVTDMNLYNLSTEKPRPPSSMSSEASPIEKPKFVCGTKPKSTIKSALPVYNRKATASKQTPNRYVRSPIANNQYVKSALTPTNPKQQFLHPAPKTTSQKKRFQNIASPVSVYIKNSGLTPLFKTVLPAKPLSCENVKVSTPRTSRKENSITFPEVIYKPAKQTIVTTARALKMPNNIDSLIPHKPNVTKHVGRLGQNNKEKISRRLLEEDLTVNDSVSTIEDTSIHYTKAAYIS